MGSEGNREFAGMTCNGWHPVKCESGGLELNDGLSRVGEYWYSDEKLLG